MTKLPALCCLCLTLCILFANGAAAEPADAWIVREGYFCTVSIRSDVDRDALNQKIDTYRVDFGLTEKPDMRGQGAQDEIAYKLDLIFSKVQELLDMRPAKIHTAVKIYRLKEEVEGVYAEIFWENGTYAAFYTFKLNTLFACEEAISAQVLAHEMAHCIIDHYFGMPPPKKIAELIAQYAELHLKE